MDSYQRTVISSARGRAHALKDIWWIFDTRHTATAKPLKTMVTPTGIEPVFQPWKERGRAAIGPFADRLLTAVRRGKAAFAGRSQFATTPDRILMNEPIVTDIHDQSWNGQQAIALTLTAGRAADSRRIIRKASTLPRCN